MEAGSASTVAVSASGTAASASTRMSCQRYRCPAPAVWEFLASIREHFEMPVIIHDRAFLTSTALASTGRAHSILPSPSLWIEARGAWLRRAGASANRHGPGPRCCAGSHAGITRRSTGGLQEVFRAIAPSSNSNSPILITVEIGVPARNCSTRRAPLQPAPRAILYCTEHAADSQD